MRNNIMLWKWMTPALLAVSVSMPAMADDEYFDYARVVGVTPQTERVNMPREECRTEYIRESYTTPDRSPVGAIIGGIAGGLLGSQVGKGNGRVAGAAVGAGIGAREAGPVGAQGADVGDGVPDLAAFRARHVGHPFPGGCAG